MKQKTFISTAGAIFTIIAVLHVLRIVLNWGANLGGMDVPMWISYLAVLVAGYLAYTANKFSK